MPPYPIINGETHGAFLYPATHHRFFGRADGCGRGRRRAVAAARAVRRVAAGHARAHRSGHQQGGFVRRHIHRRRPVRPPPEAAVEDAAARRRAGFCRLVRRREAGGLCAGAIHETGHAGDYGGDVCVHLLPQRFGANRAHPRAHAGRNAAGHGIWRGHRLL